MQRDKEAFDKMVFLVWSQADLGEVRGAPGWAPTEGRQSRQDDRAPVRRVGRPKAHARARLQRPAEFKRQQLGGPAVALS
eukprot:4612070-Pyramimonas_sp.AAC.1